MVDFAKAARNQDIAQRLVYCSAWGANPSSSGLYLKSKGETEQRLSELGYETIICRVSRSAICRCIADDDSQLT